MWAYCCHLLLKRHMLLTRLKREIIVCTKLKLKEEFWGILESSSCSRIAFGSSRKTVRDGCVFCIVFFCYWKSHCYTFWTQCRQRVQYFGAFFYTNGSHSQNSEDILIYLYCYRNSHYLVRFKCFSLFFPLQKLMQTNLSDETMQELQPILTRFQVMTIDKLFMFWLIRFVATSKCFTQFETVLPLQNRIQTETLTPLITNSSQKHFHPY